MGIDKHTIRTNTYFAGKDDTVYCQVCEDEISDNDDSNFDHKCPMCYVGKDFNQRLKRLEKQLTIFREMEREGKLAQPIVNVLNDYEWTVEQTSKLRQAVKKIASLTKGDDWAFKNRKKWEG